MYKSSSRLALLVITLLAWGVSVDQANGQDSGIRGRHAVLMEKKLTSTQRALAGLARRNFPEIEEQSQMLMLLSHEAGWNMIQTEEYRRLSDAFRATTRQLKKAAQDQDQDAVALAYIKLTISCIDCHRYADEALVARTQAEGSGTTETETEVPSSTETEAEGAP